MQAPGTPIGANMAACRAAAAGGFVVGAEPLGVASANNLGVGQYSVVLATSNQIDPTNCVPHASPGTVARVVSVTQTSDTTFVVAGSNLAAPADADAIFSFSAIRTSVGT